jgi:hypothetical protein
LRGCKGLRTGDRNAQHQQSLGREPHGRITKRYFVWVKGVELSGCVRGRLLSFDGLLLHVYSQSVGRVLRVVDFGARCGCRIDVTVGNLETQVQAPKE